jgi:formylglycine-generating enzyme required for sulfatase activity
MKPSRKAPPAAVSTARQPFKVFVSSTFLDNQERRKLVADAITMAGMVWHGMEIFTASTQPVVGVSWEDARRYASWAGLRLASEAEWEYACRAGTSIRFYAGDTEKDLDQAGWYGDNPSGKLHPVGEKTPNVWGLYDMHGNVWEWVEDDWHDSYKGAPDDGSAWIDKRRGSDRVIRGGGWGDGARYCRSAMRGGSGPGDRDDHVGFRLSRSVALGP